jgi:transcriptional regulator with XRE-family HTH domain
MLTEFGKILRKLRIDKGEILKNMADRLNMSSAYLSAIEMGKRAIPDNLVTRLIEIYALSESDIQQLKRAEAESVTQIKLDIEGASFAKKNAALVFARTFEEMDDQTVDKLLAVMKKHSGRDNA